MADTIRTLAALQTLLADNTTQAISAQDLRDMLVSVMGVYASIYIDTGTTATGTIGATPKILDGFANDGANGLSNGMTADKANNQLVCAANGDGVYLVSLGGSCTGTASKTFHLEIYAGATPSATGFKTEAGFSASPIKKAISANGLVTLVEGDVVQVFVNEDADPATNSLTLDHAQLTAIRVK